MYVYSLLADQVCPDLGNKVSGGTVQYSQSLLQGGYPEGTTATVTCSEGYTGGGDVTCQCQKWSASLPECAGKCSSMQDFQIIVYLHVFVSPLHVCPQEYSRVSSGYLIWV